MLTGWISQIIFISGNGVAENENIDDAMEGEYPENGDIDDSINRNNNNREDSVVAKIPPRQIPVEVERPHKLPSDDSEEAPRKKEVVADPFLDESDSNFFTYFIIIMFACILSYVVSTFCLENTISNN